MSSVIPEASSAAIARNARRRAQRRIARQVRSGYFNEPRPPETEAGRAYQRELARRTGSRFSGKSSMGKAGWRYASHTTLGAAIRHARGLPARSRVIISARGRTVNYDSTQLKWLMLGTAASPDFYDLPLAATEMSARIETEFTTDPHEFRVNWV